MQLKRTSDPSRALSWKGKSLAICSRRELIECVVHLSQQLAMVEGNNVAIRRAAEPILARMASEEVPESVEPVSDAGGS